MSLTYWTLWTGIGSGLLLLMLKKLNFLFDRSNNSDAIHMKMDGFIFEGKSSFKKLGLSLF